MHATVYAPSLPQLDITDEATYWGLLGQLPAAMVHLVQHNDPAPYIAYWLGRTKGSMLQAKARAAYMQNVADSIRVNGYDPEHWRTDPRNWELARDGFGPIVVTVSGGIVYPRDGSHRASILKALDRVVYAAVWKSR